VTGTKTDKWTWGEIKKHIEGKHSHTRFGCITDDTEIWYIDINREKSDRPIIVTSGEKRGVEITNHPDM